ncbi:hypothetical protein GIB67_021721 [Kingdonia uniflora]|uniref:Radical SAM core domain-containing protein n=1 Tax=Kingdonia uniflora TaxID=39325 RepID=A0A7J7LM15_9MAGN|nr:hypothetical protein GIB67_021721 [Kingdonia uniflora]
MGEFRTVVDTLYQLVPKMQIATAIICGYPGEMEEDFAQTLDLIRDYKFPQIHISQFYPRLGTSAARMKKVPINTINGIWETPWAARSMMRFIYRTLLLFDEWIEHTFREANRGPDHIVKLAPAMGHFDLDVNSFDVTLVQICDEDKKGKIYFRPAAGRTLSVTDVFFFLDVSSVINRLLIAFAGDYLKPVLDLTNPQDKGPWGALSPVPENNAIAVDYQEIGQIKAVFKGHSDYLHCVVARNSRNQVYKLIQISKNTQRHSKALKYGGGPVERRTGQ